eukprot:CAMPEP_0118722174 /NCGR_PEP_ID=MMETSP0800-20121206/31197_1 /TAXON_ID=210618 ORGANISM="Striatella unipunctata, Strain CCMP2910" /NCGR_SAMPLE_ID=MMETSP0800 /ASSEMBLY_ACC=CAM_ASM_000638 /LENGTH=220 /DNA_ID=CAMNT_0006630251 /DNA_START=258 /DNA_END=920 /DNA_ORIENTATION=-
MAELPAAPAVTNAAVNAHPDMAPAPAHAAITPAQVANEGRRKRKLEDILYSTPIGAPAAVTAAEVGAAQIRHNAAIARSAGAAVSPPWLAPALNAALAPISAQIANVTVKAMNTAQRPTGGAVIMRAKEAAGYAAVPPLPNMVPPAEPHAVTDVFAAGGLAPGAGVVPPAALPVPANFAASITSAEIGYLCRFYNDTFGIVAGDNHAQQMKKLLNYLCGP